MEDRSVNHDQEPLGAQEVSMSDMSLTDHLREVQAHEKRQQELRPAPSTSPGPYIDPIFSGSPYNLNDSNKPSDAAKLSARKRDKELSATKRAAQNRAAQRAFRSRKEGHIQELEQQVNRYKALGDAHKMLQIENHQLREYISSLQSLLIDADLDLPHPPPGLDIGMAGPSGEGNAGRTGQTQTGRSSTPLTSTRTSSWLVGNSNTRQESPRVEKRKVTILPTLAPRGTVTYGPLGGDQTMQSNIEPRLMNA